MSTLSSGFKNRTRKWRLLIPVLGVCALGFLATSGKRWINEWFPRTIGALPIAESAMVSFPDEEPHLSFVAIGDSGKPSAQRESVVATLFEETRDFPPEFVFLLGDNFYESGVGSVTDPLWQRDFEEPFSPDRFPMPFYACLGNHDYRGNIEAQVEYGLTHLRWKMPAQYYRFEKSVGDMTAEFFVLNTSPINSEDASAAEQLEWLIEGLRASTADWTIVAGHHPVFSGGDHGACRPVAEKLAPIFEKHGVDLYMSGHDHDLQLHESRQKWLQLVSGSGSKLRTVKWLDSTLFAEAAPGFARLHLTRERMLIEFITTRGRRYVHELENDRGQRTDAKVAFSSR